MISNRKKAVIHIAKAQTGMTDDEYRALLSSVGVKSSTALNGKTFGVVMKEFEKLGFRTTSAAGSKRSRKLKRKVNNLPGGKRNLMKKLEAIVLDMNLSWAYVDSIARSRFKVDTVQWLEVGDLYKLVQMMVIHQKRQSLKNKQKQKKQAAATPRKAKTKAKTAHKVKTARAREASC